MKTTWVLSDEERKRRFSKFNKIKMQRSGKASQLPELFMVFTVEEKAALGDIGAKFQPQYCPTTWLTILMTINRSTGEIGEYYGEVNTVPSILALSNSCDILARFGTQIILNYCNFGQNLKKMQM